MYHPRPIPKLFSLQWLRHLAPTTKAYGKVAHEPRCLPSAAQHTPTNSDAAVLAEGRARNILSILCQSVNRLLTNKPRRRAISSPPDMAKNTRHWRGCSRLRRCVKQGGTGIRDQAKPLGHIILLFATESIRKNRRGIKSRVNSRLFVF